MILMVSTIRADADVAMRNLYFNYMATGAKD